MFRRSSLAALLVLSACNAPGQDFAAKEVQTALSVANEVKIYIVRVTDEPDLTIDEMVELSGIQITRKCGANCERFMRKVTEHLARSKPVKCPGRDQNVLIMIKGAPPIIYSHAGHHISYRGNCYFSETSINTIIERADFIF